jgi:hypothetical protein
MRSLLASLMFLVMAGQPHAADPLLSANLFVTAEGNELFRAWETDPAGGFSIVPVKVARRGEFLSAVVLFTGCAASIDGNCNAVLDITAFDPSGKVYGEFTEQELWIGKPAPAPGRTQLAVGYMGLVIEPNDPAGTYKLVAKARDLVSGAEVVAETSFTVEPAQSETQP